MKTTIYKSYGMLAHEKEPVFTAGRPATAIYDEIEVEIPENLNPYISEAGEICVKIDGHRYWLNQVLRNRNGKPVIEYYVNDKAKKRIPLTEL